MSTAMVATGLQTIGWQGITLNVAADWALVGFGGDNRAGSFRLDADDPASASGPRGLDLRWSYVKASQTSSMLETRIKPLLESAKRQAKKLRLQPDSQQRQIEDSRHPDRSATLGFRWKSDSAAEGRIWYCNTCRRVVVVQVYGPATGRFRAKAGEILDTILCHGVANTQRWSLYGLDVEIPESYSLSGQQLMNVYIQLQFRLGQSADSLTVEQWNLANVQLKDVYLDEWYARKGSQQMAGLNPEKEEGDVRGHPALFVTGKRSGPVFWLTDGVRQLVKLRKPAMNYSGALWECPESNKAIMVQSYSRGKNSEIIGRVCESARCHGQ